MNAELRRLSGTLPPPDGLIDRNVNWTNVERQLGLTFPSTFKEYISVYGGSNWFDLYHVLFPDPNQPDGRYIENLRTLLSSVEAAGILDEGCHLYPDPGGLFPFITSSDGDYYFWKTDGQDSEQWPIMVWQAPGLFPIQSKTIAEMLFDTLNEFKVTQPHRVWVRARLLE